MSSARHSHSPGLPWPFSQVEVPEVSAVGSAAEAAWPLLLATSAAAVPVELEVSRDRVLSMRVLNMPQTHSIYMNQRVN